MASASDVRHLRSPVQGEQLLLRKSQQATAMLVAQLHEACAERDAALHELDELRRAYAALEKRTRDPPDK